MHLYHSAQAPETALARGKTSFKVNKRYALIFYQYSVQHASKPIQKLFHRQVRNDGNESCSLHDAEIHENQNS